jgi:hypothetical protein
LDWWNLNKFQLLLQFAWLQCAGSNWERGQLDLQLINVLAVLVEFRIIRGSILLHQTAALPRVAMIGKHCWFNHRTVCFVVPWS